MGIKADIDLLVRISMGDTSWQYRPYSLGSKRCCLWMFFIGARFVVSHVESVVRGIAAIRASVLLSLMKRDLRKIRTYPRFEARSSHTSRASYARCICRPSANLVPVAMDRNLVGLLTALCHQSPSASRCHTTVTPSQSCR